MVLGVRLKPDATYGSETTVRLKPDTTYYDVLRRTTTCCACNESVRSVRLEADRGRVRLKPDATYGSEATVRLKPDTTYYDVLRGTARATSQYVVSALRRTVAGSG